MNVVLHEEADAEMYRAAEWYEDEVEGLGLAFLAEIDRVRGLLAEVPDIGHPYRHRSSREGTGRVRLKRFPYSLVYVTREDEVLVVAVAHARRAPGYWAGRLQ